MVQRTALATVILVLVAASATGCGALDRGERAWAFGKVRSVGLECRGAAGLLAVELGGDPMLTQAPAGFKKLHGNGPACSGSPDASEWNFAFSTAWGFPTDSLIPVERVVEFYQELGKTTDWQYQGGSSGIPSWTRMIDGVRVDFTLIFDEPLLGDTYLAVAFPVPM